jgi:hypothetical protein
MGAQVFCLCMNVLGCAHGASWGEEKFVVQLSSSYLLYSSSCYNIVLVHVHTILCDVTVVLLGLPCQNMLMKFYGNKNQVHCTSNLVLAMLFVILCVTTKFLFRLI